MAWAAGFGRVGDALVHPHWSWLAIAVAGEAVAYIGYTLAYQDAVRAEGGAELEVPKTADLVATGFGRLAQALLAVVAYRLINLWLPMIPAFAGIPALRGIERRRPGHACTR